MTTDSIRRYLVRCNGAPVPDSWRQESWAGTLDVSTDASAAAVNLVIRGIKGTVLESPGTRTDDLLRILGSAYRADEMVSRGKDPDVHGDKWTREFAMCIGVGEPDLWNAPEVQRLLFAFLRFGPDDVWRLHCSHLPRRAPKAIQTEMDFGLAPVKREPGSVVLVSGGLDSLTVLAEAATRGERPIAVSHWASPTIHNRQVDLLLAMGQGRKAIDRFDEWSFPMIGVKLHRLGQEARERTRRTRSALFAGLGGAVAGELGLDRVYLGDNGPISLNLPINDQLVGARASRSTHPVLLARASALLSAVYERPIRVENPLWDRTRAEAIESLKVLDLARLIPTTLSCANWGWGQRTAAVPQCGVCSQCIDRRFATIAAGVEMWDQAQTYATDIFLAPLPDARTTLLALGYVRFAQRVVDRTPLQLVVDYPQLAEAILEDDPDPDATLQALIALLQRHARTVLGSLDRQRDAAGPLLSRGKVAATSLLLLSAVDPTLGAPVATAESGDIGPPDVDPIKRGSAIDVRDANTLTRRGDFWEVTYQRRPVVIRHGDGVLRFAHLINHPGKLFTPFELLVATGGVLPGAKGTSFEDAEGMHQDGGASEDPLSDPTALAQYEAEIKRLEAEIRELRARGDELKAMALAEDVKRIKQHRNLTTRPGHRTKTFASIGSRQHDAVYRSLHRFLLTMEDRHPVFGAHLRVKLRHGVANGYFPDEGEQWVVDALSNAA